jgi:hypothetical protein
MVGEGVTLFPHHPATARWAKAAHREALRLAADPELRRANLRHGETWFVGVDALPNGPDGAITGVPLEGPWTDQITAPVRWHRAQLSIVYPGYPRRDPEESTANHRFRRDRHAAHVDGLLPLGPARRRYLKEPHAFILGLPLNDTRAAPLMVYPGSHEIMGAAFAALAEADDPTEVDVTEFYQATRREVFARITPRPVHARPGEAILLHRHLLHGVAARADGDEAPPEGRMVAYFRPLTSARRWLKSP